MRPWQRKFVSIASITSARNGAGFLPCQGLYYSPTNEAPKTALIAAHYNVDFSEHYLAEYIAQNAIESIDVDTLAKNAIDKVLVETITTADGITKTITKPDGIVTTETQ